jgi:chemotaxis protein histidine kinase CheA
MLGGGLSVWSEQGKGTHIAFNIPLGVTQTPESELQSTNNIR